MPPENLAPKLGKQYIDVVDAFELTPKVVPPYMHVITQNEYQSTTWKGSSYTASVIEHLPAYVNGTAEDYMPPPLADGRKLTAVTVSEWTTEPCFDVASPLFQYDCLTSEHWDRMALFKESLGVENVSAYTQTTWGTAWLFTQLFRSYDAVIVYTKPGWKLENGAIQRFTNAMNAGVITIVENRGVHAEYLGDTYACAFDDRESLESLLNALATDEELRNTCRRQAQQIFKTYGLDTQHILAKYERAILTT